MEGARSLLAKAVVLGLAVTLPAVAQAEAEFMEALTEKYKFSDSSKVAEAFCATCHVSDSDFGLNPYGKDLAKAMADQNQKTVTPVILALIDTFDSDGDGKSNADELAAGELPGDPNGAAADTAATSGAEAPKKQKGLIPKNGYHPAIVHFPIALLIAGLLLDLAGLIRKDTRLLFAGWYNLVLGALTSLAALASGFLAMSLMKLPFKGIIYEHMLYGIGVTIVMWMMVALRVHRHEKMQVSSRIAYYALALAAFLMVSWAGHLGGVFVYGE